jgi:hypothetical protein
MYASALPVLHVDLRHEVNINTTQACPSSLENPNVQVHGVSLSSNRLKTHPSLTMFVSSLGASKWSNDSAMFGLARMH